MKNLLLTFVLLLIYPLTLQAQDGIDTTLFDELPIKQTEISQVTHLFWNAKSIQDNVRQSLPSHVSSKFYKSDGARGCKVDNVFKTEVSVEACELSDDPEKIANFIYNFNVSCNFGSYQISVCSREESKLLNQLKVSNPEKLVSDDNPFDLDSTM